VPTFLRSRSNPNSQPNPTPDPSALPFVRPAPDADITPADIPRPLTASALKVNVNDAALMSKLRSATVTDRIWQRRAWQGYESTGEVYFAFNLIGNLVSRIRFYPAADVAANAAPAYVQDASDLTPGLAEAAEAALRRISRHGSMSTLARDMAVNFNVVGECYLVQTPQSVTSVDGVLTPAPESWDIRSIDEVVIPSATPPSSSSAFTAPPPPPPRPPTPTGSASAPPPAPLTPPTSPTRLRPPPLPPPGPRSPPVPPPTCPKTPSWPGCGAARPVSPPRPSPRCAACWTSSTS
jgi:hypothetical protein